MEVDILELPCVIWVNIMKHLTLGERYKVSLTCRHLNGYFNHPSLWSHANIILIGGTTNFNVCDTLLSDKSVKLVETFGKFFQYLNLKFKGHLGRFDEKTLLLLQSLTDNCRLKALTLEVGTLTSNHHLHGNLPGTSELSTILKLIEVNALRLHELNITSWPMFPSLLHTEYDIVDVLSKSEQLNNLEYLSLFWTNDHTWSEREPILLTPEVTKQLVSRFPKLNRLSIRSPMLSEKLIKELMTPGRTKLKLLQIYVTFSKHEKGYQIPDISIDSWKLLKSSLPDLEVECTVVSRVACDALDMLLKPHLPLSKLTILKFGKFNSEILQNLIENYSKTFKSLVCFCRAGSVDQQLLELAKSAHVFDYIDMQCGLNFSTIRALATLSDRNWKKFVFVDKNVRCVSDALEVR